MSTQSHIQNFSIKNFVFWVQSYLDFADIRNLQKSHSHTFAWSAGSDIKLSSDHNLQLHFTFGGLFFQFWGTFYTFEGLFKLLGDFLHSAVSQIYQQIYEGHLSKKEWPLSPNHAMWPSLSIGVMQENI